jgi:hypothetical protein
LTDGVSVACVLYQLAAAYPPQFPPQSDLYLTALASGEARAVRILLADRGIKVSKDADKRVYTCRDLGLLDAWIRCARTAGSVEELFAAPRAVYRPGGMRAVFTA